jgi:hypothetical protein
VSPERTEHGAQHGPLDKKRRRDAANKRRADQNFVGQFFAVDLANLNGSTVAAHPGNVGRNTLRNAGYSNFDLSLAKDTRLFERAALQFRAEFFNILNQHAFRIPNLVLTTPGFGLSTSTQFDPREIQLGLRFIF